MLRLVLSWEKIPNKTINQLRARVGFTFKLEADPIADPDLIAKYPNVKGDNANLIREIRRERRIELFAEGYRWDVGSLY